MRTLELALALAVVAAPVAGAQARKPEIDPDRKAAGGQFPTGWMGRVDRPTQKLEDVKFVTMGTGYHVTAGPHAIYWNPANTASGTYTLRGTFTQTQANGMFVMESPFAYLSRGPSNSAPRLLQTGERLEEAYTIRVEDIA